MTQIALVIFREILEISLILGILTAATKDVKGTKKYILLGLISGISGALILAFFTDKISQSLDGMGQEIFNAIILALAATMISATIIWMNKHAKSISSNLKNISNEVKEGNKPLYIILIVVALSVLREGAEIVLFTYSYFISGTSLLEIIIGLFLGLICGIITGFALYLGLLKISGKYFFKITTYLLIFVAGGIAMQSIGFFINAEILPALIDPIFDLSNILPQKSYVGQFLNIFLGYIESPTLMQLLTYIALISGLIYKIKKS